MNRKSNGQSSAHTGAYVSSRSKGMATQGKCRLYFAVSRSRRLRSNEQGMYRGDFWVVDTIGRDFCDRALCMVSRYSPCFFTFCFEHVHQHGTFIHFLAALLAFLHINLYTNFFSHWHCFRILSSRCILSCFAMFRVLIYLPMPTRSSTRSMHSFLCREYP